MLLPLVDKINLSKRDRDTIRKIKAHLDEGLPVRSMQTTDLQEQILRGVHLITAKPVMYVANVAEDGFVDNPYLQAVEQYAAKEGSEVVAICAAIEAERRRLGGLVVLGMEVLASGAVVGDEARVAHLLNVLLHTLATALVFVLLRRLSHGEAAMASAAGDTPRRGS